jgi:hypothetical protein
MRPTILRIPGNIFTENGWTPWTGRTPCFAFWREKKFFCVTLILLRERVGEMREDRRHLYEGWWSWKHETSKRGTGLCFAELSRTNAPSDSPVLVPTIFLNTCNWTGEEGANTGEGKGACSYGLSRGRTVGSERMAQGKGTSGIVEKALQPCTRE